MIAKKIPIYFFFRYKQTEIKNEMNGKHAAAIVILLSKCKWWHSGMKILLPFNLVSRLLLGIKKVESHSAEEERKEIRKRTSVYLSRYWGMHFTLLLSSPTLNFVGGGAGGANTGKEQELIKILVDILWARRGRENPSTGGSDGGTLLSTRCRRTQRC